MKIFQYISSKYLAAKLLLYRNAMITIKAAKIRKKDNITVVFVLESLSTWKTESLFQLMVTHKRFNPIILITYNNAEDDRNILAQYCQEKGYSHFVETGQKNEKLWNRFHPDIILYQKPYDGQFTSNLQSLFCYITYGFHASIEDWSTKTPLFYNCWQIYYENATLRKQYAKLLNAKIPNTFATGLPMMDELLISKNNVPNQWKSHSHEKKRIIYAPHHSINPENWWQSATFLEIGEEILLIAEKYSNQIQWAFKPHPLLRYKLNKIWGKDRTDKYYQRWTEMEWSQYEEGKYLGLFKHSDAMIHDCGSFILEYLYTGNPVMYLVKDENIDSKWNETYQKAYHLHYKAKTKEEIERFIQNVISGKDNLKAKREAFMDENLIPPFGQTASQNIIDCILSADKASLMQK